MIDLVVDAALAGERFDRALARLLGSSVQGARRLITAGDARLDGKRAVPGVALREGQRVQSAAAPTADDHAPVPQPELPLVVVGETPELLVVDKPAGQPCHPLRPGERGTLANAMVARYPELIAAGEFPREAGLVNRIDNDTSGLVLVARSRAAWVALHDESRQAHMQKGYLALVEGELPPSSEFRTIDLPVDHAGQRMKIGAGQDAVTRWRSLSVGRGATLVEVELRVGRRHQIRVHLAHLGHPLVGDALYGATSNGTRAGHILHAWRLRLASSDKVNQLDYSTSPPADFWASAAQHSIERREPGLEQ